MKSAAVLMLVTVLGLAVFYKSGQPQGSADEQPQTSPPAQPETPRITEDYEQAKKETKRKVILVFGAEWCPHCVTLKGHLKDMNLDGYLVCLVDVDNEKNLSKEYKVRSLPTSVILDKGEEVSRIKGFESNKFDAWLEQNRQ